jgi:hypothetical protein
MLICSWGHRTFVLQYVQPATGRKRRTYVTPVMAWSLLNPVLLVVSRSEDDATLSTTKAVKQTTRRRMWSEHIPRHHTNKGATYVIWAIEKTTDRVGGTGCSVFPAARGQEGRYSPWLCILMDQLSASNIGNRRLGVHASWYGPSSFFVSILLRVNKLSSMNCNHILAMIQ